MALDLTKEHRELGKANFEAAAASPELNRRGFMKTVAAGAGVIPVAAAVYFGYESVHGKPVKAALIGCGDEGTVLFGQHNPDYIEFIAACDIRPSNRRRIIETETHPLRGSFKRVYGKNYAEDIDKNHFYDDYKRMLDKEKDIEAVVIALPLHLHADVSIDCLKAGKHVLCEKLMAGSITDCRRMIDAAKQNRRILSIGHQRHYSLLYAQAYEMIQSGILGDVKHIRALWHRNFSWDWQAEPGVELAMGVVQPRFRDGWTPPILKNDYDALKDKLGNLSDHRYGYKTIEELIRWRLYKRTGGGLMAELGSHQLDAASIFLGKVHPIAVQGVGTKSFFGPGRNDREIDDHVFVSFEFPGKNHPKGPNGGSDDKDIVVVTYSSISTNGFEQYGECLMGTRGTLIVEKEQSAFLFKEPDPGKKATPPRSTTTTVGSTPAGKPVLETGSTWGGPPPSATGASVGPGGAPVDISRGYREEMEDFAYCIRQWDAGLSYAKKTEKGKEKEYVQRLPRCHGEVALADAVLALSANNAMRLQKRIDLKKDEYFQAESTELPEGEARR